MSFSFIFINAESDWHFLEITSSVCLEMSGQGSKIRYSSIRVVPGEKYKLKELSLQKLQKETGLKNRQALDCFSDVSAVYGEKLLEVWSFLELKNTIMIQVAAFDRGLIRP